MKSAQMFTNIISKGTETKQRSFNAGMALQPLPNVPLEGFQIAKKVYFRKGLKALNKLQS
jgi:hypothetical protein